MPRAVLGAARARASSSSTTSSGARSSTVTGRSGRVRDVLLLPSADALEVERPGGEPLLVPLVGDAVRSVDTSTARADRRRHRASWSGSAPMNIDVFTLFPEWFDWFLRPAPRRATRCASATTCGSSTTATRRRCRTARSTTRPYGGGAGMVIRVDVVDAALQAVYGRHRARCWPPPGGSRCSTPSGRPFDDAVADELRRPRVAHAALRPLRGHRRARARAPRRRRDLDRALRALGRRAGGDGGRRRGAAQAARRARRRAQRGRGVVQRARWRAASSTRTTRAPPRYRGWEVPEVLLSGHHAQVRSWRLEQARRRSSGVGLTGQWRWAASANISAPIESPATPPPEAALSSQ